MLVALLAFAFLPALTTASNITVTVKNGTYVGFEGFPKQEHFLGVPYAQQPLPPHLRLRPPQSLNSSWTGTRNATSYSNICLGYTQPDFPDDVGYPEGEDCLTINIVRPRGVKKGSKVPVMLWIYGGDFAAGGSASIQFNGSWIVERSVEMNQPIIYTSINYRVASLGFIWGRELAAEGTANLGLLDQRKALEWVHENIAAFGGDPTKVTIAGQSSGGTSVSLQLLGYGETSTPLFRGGIVESSTATTWNYPTLNDSQIVYDKVVNQTGCSGSDDTLACLRSVDVAAFIESMKDPATVAQGPVVDGKFITQAVSESIDSGTMTKTSLLIGQNTDEATIYGVFMGLDNETAIAESLLALYPGLTNETIQTLLELYPDDPAIGCPYHTGDALLPTGTQDKRGLAIFGDILADAGRRKLAEAMARRASVFSYRFDQPPDNATILQGTQHGAELPYVFSNPLPALVRLSKRAGDAELAKLVTSHWISFVVHQDPNHTGIKGAVNWPDYRHGAKSIVFQRRGNFVEDDVYRKDGIAFINTIGPELKQ